MPEGPIFVGRQEELKELHAAIADPKGKLVLVVGREGSGKSALLRALHGQLIKDERRFSLPYRVNANDTSESSFYRLMGDLFNTRNLTKGHWVQGAPYQPERWKALLKLLPKVGDAAASLAPDDRRPRREQFLDYLRATAGRLLEWQRLVLIFDPGEKLNDSMEPDLISIASSLPDCVTIIFEQRPDDCLAHSVGIRRAGAQRAPARGLNPLSERDHTDLVHATWKATPAWSAYGDGTRDELARVLWNKYRGWALPLDMALRWLKTAATTADELLLAARDMPEDVQALLRSTTIAPCNRERPAACLLHGLAILARPTSTGRLATLWEGAASAQSLLAVGANRR